MKKTLGTFKPVMAAEFDFDDIEDAQSVRDAADDASDAIDDLQDAVDDISDAPADTILDIENNIENHYVAECDRCHDIFISAMTESDTDVESIEGECPCCHEQTKQTLKWIVRDKNFGKQA